jgi:excisionase family DNA binding protein
MDAPIFSSIRKIKDPLGYHRVKVYNGVDFLKYLLFLRIEKQLKKQDSLYLICAPEGGGKSNFTLTAYHLYSELKCETPDINNITRNVDELMARYSALQRNSFVSLDEAQELASDRWSEKKSKEIKEKFTVMRERAFISMICYPNPLKVSIYFREDRIRGVFFIKSPGCAYYYANSMENPHFAEILESWDKFNKTRSIKKFSRYAPDFILYYPEYNGDLRKDYDRRKDENISKVLDRNVEAVNKPENYLTALEAAKYLHITNGTVHLWIKSGKLTTHPFGLYSYVLKEDLDKILYEKHKDKINTGISIGTDANILKIRKNVVANEVELL